PLGRRRQSHSGDCMSFIGQLQEELAEFKKEGVYKRLNYLDSPQDPRVKMEGRGEVVILSSNNYLGLCDVPEVVQAGKDALEHWGAGTASVRFICGTFTIHRELETALAQFVGCESALTYVSCWSANEGLCPTVLSEPDLVISDQLNHASIIDSIRLAKAITKCQTAVYKHSDMKDLEDKLRAATNARRKLIFTDGIFSMEGDIAKLPDLAALARKYDAAHPELVTKLHANARYFRDQLLALGLKPLPGETPIVPVILGETAKAIHMSELLLAEGVFVTGFGYPVVPQGHARVRCQLSAAHTRDDLDFALRAFKKVGSKLGLI